MRQVISTVYNILNRFMDLLAVLAGVLFTFMMFIIVAEVVSRTFFKSPIIWFLEVTEYIMLYGTFLAAAWLLKRDGHVRIDIVLTLLTPRGRAILNIINSIILAAVCLLLVWFGTETTVDHFQRGIMEVKQYEIPKFILLSVIPLAGVLLFFETVKRVYRNIRELKAIQRRDDVSVSSTH